MCPARRIATAVQLSPVYFCFTHLFGPDRYSCSRRSAVQRQSQRHSQRRAEGGDQRAASLWSATDGELDRQPQVIRTGHGRVPSLPLHRRLTDVGDEVGRQHQIRRTATATTVDSAEQRTASGRRAAVRTAAHVRRHRISLSGVSDGSAAQCASRPRDGERPAEPQRRTVTRIAAAAQPAAATRLATRMPPSSSPSATLRAAPLRSVAGAAAGRRRRGRGRDALIMTTTGRAAVIADR